MKIVYQRVSILVFSITMDRNFYVPEVTLDLQANAAAMQSDDFDAPHLEVRPEISQRISQRSSGAFHKWCYPVLPPFRWDGFHGKSQPKKWMTGGSPHDETETSMFLMYWMSQRGAFLGDFSRFNRTVFQQQDIVHCILIYSTPGKDRTSQI